MPTATGGGASNITGANITDGTISNDDIASNAAIVRSKLNSNVWSYAAGVATKQATDASTTQTIPHGLSFTPTKIRLAIMAGTTSSASICGIGISDGTKQQFVWRTNNGTAGGTTSYSIGFGSVNTDPGSTGQTGVVRVDDTNIYIDWTLHGSPVSNTVSFLWEAE